MINCNKVINQIKWKKTNHSRTYNHEQSIKERLRSIDLASKSQTESNNLIM